jgi:4a-hydroxytetrahydrobiopterin dehydratase
MSALWEKRCVPCEQGAEPLRSPVIQLLKGNLSPSWKVMEDRRLEREFKFRDFKTALEFVNKVGNTAEAEGHHPDVFLSWGEVRITLSTHAAGGLTENDFILAAKIDRLPQ